MTDTKHFEYKEGYKDGMQAALRGNDHALRIGNAILEILDERYQRYE